MRSLFWKIFLSFWGTQIVVLVLAFLAAYLGIGFGGTRSPDQIRQDLPSIGETAVQAWESGGAPALNDKLERFATANEVRLWLLDSKQQQLSGTSPLVSIRGPVGHLRGNTAGSLNDQPRILSTQISGAHDDHYLIVAELLPTRLGHFPYRPLLRQLIVGFVVSGFTCLWVAHSLSRPIVRLRHTAHAVTAGDLSARAGEQIGSRRDEIGDLVRDFDQMTSRIQDVLEDQKRLLRDISHDLRSPLQRLRMALGLARRNDGTVEGQLDRIEREAVRMDGLIEQLLSLAKLDSAEVRPSMSKLALNDIIESVVGDAQFEAERNKRDIVLSSDGEIWVNGNEELLHSAFENVVRNAIRYTPAGTAVEIALKVDDAAVTVSVRDHGPGVPDAAVAHLFRPFFRVDQSRGTRTGGAGLGLAISARAVQLHGGTIQARNVEPHGLLVEIKLPVVRATVAELVNA